MSKTIGFPSRSGLIQRPEVSAPQIAASEVAVGGSSSASRASTLAGGAFESREAGRGGIVGMDESFERNLIGGKNKAGKLVELYKGDPAKGLAVSIHGINSSPREMKPLAEMRIKQDVSAQTYAYDDNYRRLTETSKDLAKDLRTWMAQNPGKPLRLDAHSMGSRITLGALGELKKEGLLEGRKIEVNLIDPPLQGYKSANAAKTALGPFALIKNVNPGKDMGSTSDFQKELESLRLPSNVELRIFTAGTKDGVVETEAGEKTGLKFQEIARNLGAAPPIHFEHASHSNADDPKKVSVVDEAARWLAERG